MKKVFVSGTFDLLHAGHIQFFKDARKLGNYLVVNFCSEKNLLIYKKRKTSMPDDNKKIILESIRYIDKVYIGTDDGGVWDFVPSFLKEQPDILAITTDDKHSLEKKEFCKKNGVKLVILPKKIPQKTSSVSTTKIRENIKNN